MKEVYKYSPIKSFTDEKDIEQNIRNSKGLTITDSYNVSEMVNGESIIDSVNLREVKNINGQLFVPAIVNNEIKYKLLEL